MFVQRDGQPGSLYHVRRGIENIADVGRILSLNNYPNLAYWVGDDEKSAAEPSRCNMINGTDSGLFAPFIDRTQSLYALNTDICR